MISRNVLFNNLIKNLIVLYVLNNFTAHYVNKSKLNLTKKYTQIQEMVI